MNYLQGNNGRQEIYLIEKMVPRDGIEPPTRSSSGFCSTTELPRHSFQEPPHMALSVAKIHWDVNINLLNNQENYGTLQHIGIFIQRNLPCMLLKTS